MLWILPLLALVSPLFLWPIELYLPYPYLLEEIVKAGLLYPLITSGVKFSDKIKLAIIVGVLFSITESVLYLFNIYQIGTLSTFINRLLVTSTLHVVTVLIITLPTKGSKYWIILGLLMAIGVHYLFNEFVRTL
jgi:hypothetical protein